MAGTTRKAQPRTFEVVVSFDGLDAGERFSQQPDELAWAMRHVKTGYLRDVTEEAPDAGEAGQG